MTTSMNLTRVWNLFWFGSTALCFSTWQRREPKLMQKEQGHRKADKEGRAENRRRPRARRRRRGRVTTKPPPPETVSQNNHRTRINRQQCAIPTNVRTTTLGKEHTRGTSAAKAVAQLVVVGTHDICTFVVKASRSRPETDGDLGKYGENDVDRETKAATTRP